MFADTCDSWNGPGGESTPVSEATGRGTLVLHPPKRAEGFVSRRWRCSVAWRKDTRLNYRYCGLYVQKPYCIEGGPGYADHFLFLGSNAIPHHSYDSPPLEP